MIDVLERLEESKSTNRVKSDYIVETHHFRRVIRLKKGITLKTKKYLGPKGEKSRYDFRVTDLSIFWREGEPVEYVMAYGVLIDDEKLNCRRRYSPDKLPKELRELIGEKLKCPAN